MFTCNREAIQIPIGTDGDSKVHAVVKELTGDGEICLWSTLGENQDLTLTDLIYQGKLDVLIKECVDLPDEVSIGMLSSSVRINIFEAWKGVGGNSDFFERVEMNVAAHLLGDQRLSGTLSLLNSGSFSSLNEDTEAQSDTEESDL